MEAAVQGAPKVVPGNNDGHDFDFTWVKGGLSATLAQARKGAQDLIAAQISSGAVNSDSSVTVNPDNTFTLHISKDVAGGFVTVVVDCTGNVAASADGKSTVFNMTGTVDAGGLGDAAQVTSQLQTWVANWETQAQKEPVAATQAGRDLGL